jgi:hypothetical protein
MQLIGQCHRVILSFFAVLVLCASLTIAATVAHADGGSGGCSVINPSCTVGAGGGGGNGGGGDGAATGGGGAGCQNTDPKDGGCNPCPPDAAYGSQPPAVSQVCADFLQNGYCGAILGDILGGLKYPSVNNLIPAQTAIVNQNLAANSCPAIVTTATLAQQAYASITFPHPSGHRSPSEVQDYNGYPFTYVGLWTYYWTDPATWKPLTASASAAGLTATVTAVPVSLSFNPGDGSGGLSCAGPGRAWVESDGNNAPSDGACGYRYSRVTGPSYDHPITSAQTIVWKIMWTGTGNTGGEIPGLSTSTSGQLNVLQIKTVNR